jgi:hypothetical protein
MFVKTNFLIFGTLTLCQKENNMLVYIAGPYRGEIDHNIAQAREIAIKVWESGNVAICPHLNTAHFELDCSCVDSDYLQGDLEIVARCDAVLLTPDWYKSIGAMIERNFAIDRHIPVYVYPDMPTRHSKDKYLED